MYQRIRQWELANERKSRGNYTKFLLKFSHVYWEFAKSWESECMLFKRSSRCGALKYISHRQQAIVCICRREQRSSLWKMATTKQMFDEWKIHEVFLFFEFPVTLTYSSSSSSAVYIISLIYLWANIKAIRGFCACQCQQSQTVHKSAYSQRERRVF